MDNGCNEHIAIFNYGSWCMSFTYDYEMWYNVKLMCVAKVVSKGCLVRLVLWDANFTLHKLTVESAKVKPTLYLGIVGGFALCFLLLMYMDFKNLINVYLHINVPFWCINGFYAFHHT